MPQPFAITPAQLARLLGTPDAPAIIDVRLPEDLASLPRVIPTSRIVPHADLPSITATRVVVTCMGGAKLSEGAAAILRTRGVQAEILEGGTQAWAAADLAMTPIGARPKQHLWVTRHRPKIDRIACPWLLRRWVDPSAKVLFEAPTEVLAVAQRFEAIAFDVEGASFSHRGPNCTFDTMLDAFGLHSPALDRLATVIRAADTDTHALAPQAAGLLAISVGLSRLYRDDLAQMEAGMLIYDALYRWARDGQDEGHDWPAGRGAQT
jgi:rhodanese-related sulfurtransferase